MPTDKETTLGYKVLLSNIITISIIKHWYYYYLLLFVDFY